MRDDNIVKYLNEILFDCADGVYGRWLVKGGGRRGPSADFIDWKIFHFKPPEMGLSNVLLPTGLINTYCQ